MDKLKKLEEQAVESRKRWMYINGMIIEVEQPLTEVLVHEMGHTVSHTKSNPWFRPEDDNAYAKPSSSEIFGSSIYARSDEEIRKILDSIN